VPTDPALDPAFDPAFDLALDLALDPEAARKAFEAVLPRLQALSTDDVLHLTTDLQRAAYAAAAIARQVSVSPLRERFAELPARTFDQSSIDDLEPVSLACWYAAVEQLSAKATTTDVKLPAVLVHSATDIRTRMLNLLDYHLGDDPVYGLELASIRRGGGHTDIANDLVRLGKLWLMHHDDIKDDRKNYDASDGDNARKYAQTIFVLLGGPSEQQRHWTDLVARAWTLLLQVYDEVAETGRWLLRHDDPKLSFPSLYAAGRNPRSSTKKTDPTDPTDPTK
jgi:hypothetical protein